ncbi:MAG TPA: B12-binding domain-containing radical SAM protein [Clostridiaceae bacterium]|nr:B12-binding domain-containing radical SAM protein [Clostridiaceae bacterium]
MKTLLVALNSKYIHSSLAVWYLKAYCSNEDEQAYNGVEIAEYTINDNIESILGSICLKKPEIICFSCYIWNIEYVLKLTRNIKKLMPECIIILGGPEVSYDAEKIMEAEPSVDFIISGEGETALKNLLQHIRQGQVSHFTHIKQIRGLTYREKGEIKSTEPCTLIENLDEIPSPYTDEFFILLKNRIVYYESSRGCPFNCSYCLSSTIAGVRYFSLDRVKKDISILISRNVRQVKFVDRTFNANKKRAKEIFKYIIEESAKTRSDINFHFEMGGDLFDEEMLDILSTAPPGLIQFEIGVQTTNQDALKEIDRITDYEKLKNNIQRLISNGNIHIHLDLIAGLPYEDYESFIKSFNDVYSLNPHHLQLGFLKLLKGSKIRRQSGLHGYIFRDYPPYEVLSNKYISYNRILTLKAVEELVERYYNSGRFTISLRYITKKIFHKPFDFYYSFSKYYETCGYYEKSLGAKELYRVLYEFIEAVADQSSLNLIKDLLRLDFLKCDSSGSLPDILKSDTPKEFKDECFQFLREEDNIKKYLPGFNGMTAKDMYKKVHFQIFDYNIFSWKDDIPKEKVIPEKTVVLFDYTKKDRVTGWFTFTKLDTSYFPSLSSQNKP